MAFASLAFHKAVVKVQVQSTYIEMIYETASSQMGSNAVTPFPKVCACCRLRSIHPFSAETLS